MKKEYLKNRAEVVEKLGEMMLELDRERNLFQIDIYLYVDEEGNGTLEYFNNPGGNSYLRDSHYTIWTCKSFFGSILDEYQLDDIVDVLKIPVETLKALTAESLECDVEDVDIYEIHDYIEGSKELMSKMEEDYNYNLSMEGDYADMAEKAVEEYEEHQEMLEKYYSD